MVQETSRRKVNEIALLVNWPHRWPEWVAYAACAWSLLYGLLGLYWALGGGGFPFGHEHDPGAAISILANLTAATSAPVIAALGLIGAVLALLMTRPRGCGILRTLLLGFARGLAVALALLIPDYRVLVAVGYTPIFLIGAPFGWPPVSFSNVIPWPVMNQFLCIIGGCLWGTAALVYQRITQGACAYCGRSATGAGWTTPATAARWGRWATLALAIVPAALVAVLVTTAGLMFVRVTLLSGFTDLVPSLDLNLGENWATIAPELLWPAWGVALGAATLAYYYRRRGRCRHCGRD
jgi:hypothetical protein